MKKRLLALLIVIALLPALSSGAFAAGVSRSQQTVNVDGVQRSFDVYTVDGYNYFKLRDIAFVLNGTPAQFSVDYDDTARVIKAVTGSPYQPNGTEMDIGADKSGTAAPSSQKLMINDKIVDLKAYAIGGNNYFKLRELGIALGFEVAYNEKLNSVEIGSTTFKYQRSGLPVAITISGQTYRVGFNEANLVSVTATKGEEYFLDINSMLNLLSCYDGTLKFYKSQKPSVGVLVSGEGSKFTWKTENVYFSSAETGIKFTLTNAANGHTYVSEEKSSPSFINNEMIIIEHSGSVFINGSRCLPVKATLDALGLSYTMHLDTTANLLVFSFNR